MAPDCKQWLLHTYSTHLAGWSSLSAFHEKDGCYLKTRQMRQRRSKSRLMMASSDHWGSCLCLINEKNKGLTMGRCVELMMNESRKDWQATKQSWVVCLIVRVHSNSAKVSCGSLGFKSVFQMHVISSLFYIHQNVSFLCWNWPLHNSGQLWAVTANL